MKKSEFAGTVRELTGLGKIPCSWGTFKVINFRLEVYREKRKTNDPPEMLPCIACGKVAEDIYDELYDGAVVWLLGELNERDERWKDPDDPEDFILRVFDFDILGEEPPKGGIKLVPYYENGQTYAVSEFGDKFLVTELK